MLFCPQCSNMLTNDMGQEVHAFVCRSCPYQFPITRKLSARTVLKQKEVDDVMGGAKAWENVDKTEIRCPKCEHDMAYFRQIQIRSADEPTTQFYRCCNDDCRYEWRLD
ncbi:DNA-directed RNA polymerase III subunit RPC10 [Dimargaris cristalligena]|uniref:DNA-directed RNA polymerase subunit n=1 Tax=Dimargaris cristalligena TaxID=215637 RepID=A0A4Q0A044_9FUNG|nr:DNA-directed RNA polymerase III subunit RPC10 [Dimargaris cristalligena]RKP39354.1 DNA-directed RNA polymerase III subunit RPC10 [Dimargaris cristalligena]|eukprot:RKP39354.1 DNA-directed RNA polymerase III subunit RPC10 [Dimargaris cristalligena]